MVKLLSFKKYFSFVVILAVSLFIFSGTARAQSLKKTLRESKEDVLYYKSSQYFHIHIGAKDWLKFLEEQGNAHFADQEIDASHIPEESWPEVVLEVDKWADFTWNTIVEELGYLIPYESRTGKINIYLQDISDPKVSGFVDLDEEGVPFIVLEKDLDYKQIKTVLAHEIFHVFQFGYDPFYALEHSSKLAEGTAIWGENHLFPEQKVYQEYVDQSALNIPEQSVFGSLGDVDLPNSISRYGSFLWYQYLTETFGDEIILYVWESFYRLSESIDSKKQQPYYRSFLAHREVLKRFDTTLQQTYENYLLWVLDTKQQKHGYDFPPVHHTLRVNKLPFESQDRLIRFYPQLFGANFHRIRVKDNKPLVIDFSTKEDVVYSLILVPKTSQGYDFSRKIIQHATSNAVNRLVFHPQYFDEDVSFVVAVSGTITPLDFESSDDIFISRDYPYEFKVNTGKRVKAEEINHDLLEVITAEYQEDVEQTQKNLVTKNQEQEYKNRRIERMEEEVTKEKREDIIFTDIDSNNKYSSAIKNLNREGIMKGYPDKTFRPKELTNRAEFIATLYRALNYPLEQRKNCFRDVKKQWFAPAVCTALTDKIISKNTSQQFRPVDPITLAAAYKMSVELLYYAEVEEGDAIWYQPYLDFADQKQLMISKDIDPTSYLNREQMAQLLYLLRKADKH